MYLCILNQLIISRAVDIVHHVNSFFLISLTCDYTSNLLLFQKCINFPCKSSLVHCNHNYPSLSRNLQFNMYLCITFRSVLTSSYLICLLFWVSISTPFMYLMCSMIAFSHWKVTNWNLNLPFTFTFPEMSLFSFYCPQKKLIDKIIFEQKHLMLCPLQHIHHGWALFLFLSILAHVGFNKTHKAKLLYTHVMIVFAYFDGISRDAWLNDGSSECIFSSW